MKRFLFSLLFLLSVSLSWSASRIEVNSSKIEHDVDYYGLRGMNVYLDLTAYQATNQLVKVRLVLYDQNGNEVKAPNASFGGAGKVFNLEYIYGVKNGTEDFEKFFYFIPYSAFSNMSRGDYYIKGWIYLTDNYIYPGDSKARTENMWFTYLGKSTQAMGVAGTPSKSSDKPVSNTPSHTNTKTTNTVVIPVSTTPAPMPRTVYEQCSACHGTGRVEHYTYTSQVGTFFCYECGRECTYGHSHVNCQICGGRGTIERTVYY